MRDRDQPAARRCIKLGVRASRDPFAPLAWNPQPQPGGQPIQARRNTSDSNGEFMSVREFLAREREFISPGSQASTHPVPTAKEWNSETEEGENFVRLRLELCGTR
jgi:hypothetical protein